MPARRTSLTNLLLGSGAALAAAAVGLVAYQRLAPAGTDTGDALQLPGDLHVSLPHLASETMRVIYLNREGATLTGGDDDSAHDMSSIVRATGKASVHIPAFQGSPQTWSALAECIRGKFAPFEVSVVDERPTQGRYIMAVVGGTPEDLEPVTEEHGEVHAHEDEHDVLGLAPFNGHLVPDAVVLIFAHRAHERVLTTCETAGMEIAHAYGLDHERNCKDLMTYMPACGPRIFANATARCGEDKDRACEGGEKTQNSYAKLLAALGPASGATGAAAAR
jgi:hypothetical protein